MIPLIIAAIFVAVSVFIFLKPIRFALRVLLNIALGFAALMIINFVGGQFGIDLAVNWPNAIVTGVLGIPGVAVLIVLDYLAII